MKMQGCSTYVTAVIKPCTNQPACNGVLYRAAWAQAEGAQLQPYRSLQHFCGRNGKAGLDKHMHLLPHY